MKKETAIQSKTLFSRVMLVIVFIIVNFHLIESSNASFPDPTSPLPPVNPYFLALGYDPGSYEGGAPPPEFFIDRLRIYEYGYPYGYGMYSGSGYGYPNFGFNGYNGYWNQPYNYGWNQPYTYSGYNTYNSPYGYANYRPPQFYYGGYSQPQYYWGSSNYDYPYYGGYYQNFTQQPYENADIELDINDNGDKITLEEGETLSIRLQSVDHNWRLDDDELDDDVIDKKSESLASGINIAYAQWIFEAVDIGTTIIRIEDKENGDTFEIEVIVEN